MDILGSEWSNSSDWSGSQDNHEQQDIYPFLEPDKEKAEFSSVPQLASVSEQTNVMMTGGSAMTGSSSFGQGTSRPMAESTCCSPVSAAMPSIEQQSPSAQAQDYAADGCDEQNDAASEFSRSSSSNWGHEDHSHTAAPGSNRMQLSELIGRGAFGSVYRGLWKGRPAAIKVTKLLASLDHESVQHGAIWGYQGLSELRMQYLLICFRLSSMIMASLGEVMS